MVIYFYKHMHLTNKVYYITIFSEKFKHMRLITRIYGIVLSNYLFICKDVIIIDLLGSSVQLRADSFIHTAPSSLYFPVCIIAAMVL